MSTYNGDPTNFIIVCETVNTSALRFLKRLNYEFVASRSFKCFILALYLF